MKKSIILPFLLTNLLFITACAPIYKCGEPIPAKKNIFWIQPFRAVIDERDTLCHRLTSSELREDSLKRDTLKYKITIREQEYSINELRDANNKLSVEYNKLYFAKKELQKNYDELQNEKLSDAEQYNKAMKQKSEELKQKSEELQQKEKLIAEREKSLKELQQVISRQDSVSKQLQNNLRKALLGFKADELSVKMKNGKVYVSMTDKLLFKSGSASVESKGIEALKVLANVLLKNPDIDVLVEGHTDNIPMKSPTIKDNWDLSVMRATSIVRILTQDYNIPPTRVTASGRGEFFPKATNETPEGRALNRRTEIILSPKLDEVMRLLNKN